MKKNRYTPLQEELQQPLKKLRNDAGLRQIDMANKLGQSQSFVSKYEMGERLLTFLEVREICHELGLTMSDFAEKFERMLNETK